MKNHNRMSRETLLAAAEALDLKACGERLHVAQYPQLGQEWHEMPIKTAAHAKAIRDFLSDEEVSKS